MARPPLSEEQRQAKRERILSAAYGLLLKDGLPGLTSRAIARAVGIAHMTLFTYFENQTALLDALAARTMAPLVTELEQLESQAAQGDMTAVMRAALALYPRFAAANPDLFRLAWANLPPEGHPMARTQERAQAHVAHLARLIRLGIEQGVFHDRDSRIAAATVLAMVLAPPIIYQSGRIPSAQVRDTLVEEILDAALLYLTHPPRRGQGQR